MTEKDEKIVKVMRRAVAETAKVTTSEAKWKSWDSVAIMTARTVRPGVVWSKAFEARRDVSAAYRKHRSEIEATGLWDEYPQLLRRTARAKLAVFRLFISAILHFFRFLGMLDHAKDCEVLREFCSA